MFARRFAAAAFLVAGSTLSAQQPMMGPGGPPPGGAPMGAMAGMGPMAGATFLLAHTGDLQLTDQQVVKLAGIARRESARRKSMMAGMDSMRRAGMAMQRDTAGPRRMEPAMMTRMTQVRDQVQADLRDAIAVLTPDQQAKAWTMVARGGAMRRQGQMRERMQGMRMRQGRPGEMGPQGPPQNGMRGRAGGGGPPVVRGQGRAPVRPPVQ